jgi:hypothetical protein
MEKAELERQVPPPPPLSLSPPKIVHPDRPSRGAHRYHGCLAVLGGRLPQPGARAVCTVCADSRVPMGRRCVVRVRAYS